MSRYVDSGLTNVLINYIISIAQSIHEKILQSLTFCEVVGMVGTV